MKAHWKNLVYLLRHKWFVAVAGWRHGVSLWRLLIHDWSKFTPDEWGPYAAFFYGMSVDEEMARGAYNKETAKALVREYQRGIRPDFDRAWLHHQHWNKHHWQHWVLRNDDGSVRYLEMPAKYVGEMVADWCGAGRAAKGVWEVWVWYEKNKDKILLHPHTRILVEELIEEEKRHHVPRTDG